MRRYATPETIFKTDPHGWMVTFADLVMLLLTFFVMLLTMKSMDRSALREMMGQTIQSTGPLPYNTSGRSSGTRMVVQIPAKITSPKMLENMLSQAGETLVGKGGVPKHLEDLVGITSDARGVVISIGTDDLFDSGKAVLKKERLPILNALGHLLARVSNSIVIMGYADNVPIRGGVFTSNWDLSFYRALAVYTYLSHTLGISGDRMAVGGFGDQRPLFSNATPAGRAKNRRIEFILKPPV